MFFPFFHALFNILIILQIYPLIIFIILSSILLFLNSLTLEKFLAMQIFIFIIATVLRISHFLFNNIKKIELIY